MQNKVWVESVQGIYHKFRLFYYHRLFRHIASKKEDSLTAVEAFCAEAIHCLERPTISEFAEFINVTLPNATYKVANLERKGYIRKIKSDVDGRLIFVEVTDKYRKMYGFSEDYAQNMLEPLSQKYSEEELELFMRIVNDISDNYIKDINEYLEERVYPFEKTLGFRQEELLNGTKR